MTMFRWTARAGRARAALGAAVLALSLVSPVLAQEEAPVRGVVTVDEAVRRALANNYDLLTTRENILSAEGRRNQAKQQYLPGISANGSYRKNFDGTFAFADPNRFSTNYALRQNLIDLQALRSIRATGHGLEATRLDYTQARADLVLATREQFYALYRAQLLAAVADSALVVSQQDLRRVQSLFELGMVAKGDVLKGQVRLSQSQLDVISNRNLIVIERGRLARIMGQTPNDDLVAGGDVSTTPAVIDSAGVFEEAVRNRSDLKAAEANRRAAAASLGAAKAGYYPRLSGALSYNQSGEDPFQGFRSRSGSLSLNFPLFESLWGTKGDIQQRRASRNQAEYALEQARLTIAVEVRQTISNARQANEGLLVAQDQVISAEEDLKLSQEKYNVGAGTILELIDAQVALQRARSNFVQGLTQVRTAEASLERVRGRTY